VNILFSFSAAALPQTVVSMIRRVIACFVLPALVAVAVTRPLSAQSPYASVLTPNLAERIERPLRYRPEGTDFVIENGGEFFNRPLYGPNLAFRVDAGDRPEFSLYLPGRGGNLRFGIRTAAGVKWVQDAARIVARYRPASMLYEITDPFLGGGTVLLTALTLPASEGLIVRVEFVAEVPAASAATAEPAGHGPVELVWAYGGVNGRRGARDGDIGTERVPIGQYFQLEPEQCRDNTFTIEADRFTLRSKAATIIGVVSPGATLAVADATKWTSCEALCVSAGSRSELPVIVGRAMMPFGAPLFVALQRVAQPGDDRSELSTYLEVKGERPAGGGAAVIPGRAPPLTAENLPQFFAAAERRRSTLAGQVAVDTPDPFINAAAAALNVVADAVWAEPQGAVMHGAIAWRSKLLGWRGPYAMDALGWHDRARRHFAYWATRQNTSLVPAKLPPPDENTNLARSEAALHSNGDISNSHYDMNLVFIDALFRHLLWTGDLDFARQVWPVIERHLAWERRLFRREFGPEKLPLYEAYACIWASDDLQYNGGGVTHASAYNYWHNRMAARLATLLGHDPAPYEHEADLIAQGMRKHLWLAGPGMFAEFKDSLGLQRVHPSAGLWTFYHTMDSELPTPQEAWQMTRYVDREIPHLPVRGPGVPTDQPYAVLSTSNWLPYTWSVNNVVMGENVHTALAYWQAGCADEAFRLTKSALLASMFMGICPGNVGSMNYLDVYRRESQRDFADGGGMLARAIVEGLFGVKPDLLAGELLITPGFPATWTHASLRHPDVEIGWRRTGEAETYSVESRFAKPVTLCLQVTARGADASVTVNGRAAGWRWLDQAAPRPRLEIQCSLNAPVEIAVSWKGVLLAPAADEVGQGRRTPSLAGEAAEFGDAAPPAGFASAGGSSGAPDWRTPLPATAKLETVDLAPYFNDRVTQIFRHEYRSPRSPFVSLAIPKQGLGGWAGKVNASAEIDDTGLRAVADRSGGRLVLPNGVPFATPGPGDAPNIIFTSQWDNFPREATVPLSGKARQVYLLMAGSTNWMQSRLDNGEVIVAYADGTIERLALHNPTNWWPIDQDYFIDDFQFRRPEAIPPRVDLRTGTVRLLTVAEFKGRGGPVPGGAATVLDLPLSPDKELKSLTVRTLANEVVIGLMGLTLKR
jgi:hypothetical protein